jgi:hypothetical protein
MHGIYAIVFLHNLLLLTTIRLEGSRNASLKLSLFPQSRLKVAVYFPFPDKGPELALWSLLALDAALLVIGRFNALTAVIFL